MYLNVSLRYGRPDMSDLSEDGTYAQKHVHKLIDKTDIS